MNPDTSELKTMDELRDLYGDEKGIEEAGFVPVPPHLDLAAQALLEFRNDVRKDRARRRNKIAKNSRRKNRGGA